MPTRPRQSWVSASVAAFSHVRIGFGIGALLAATALVQGQDAAIQKRPATVADSIQMTRWADQGYFVGGAPGPVGLFSPDHSHFVVVVKKGDLERNRDEYSLLLFNSKEAFTHPKPRVLVRMSSASNRDGITGVKWLADSESLLFLGETPGTNPQVYGVNIRTNRLEQLTTHSTAIVAYSSDQHGDRIIYQADPPPKNLLETEATRKSGIVVTTQFPTDLMLVGDTNLPKATQGYKDVFIKRIGGHASKVSIADFVLPGLPLSMSPDGRYAVFAVYVAHVPPRWSEYGDRLLRPYITAPLKPGVPFNVQQYMLADIYTGRVTPLVDAPMGWHNTGCLWSRDSRSIILSGIYLPLDLTDETQLAIRRQQPFVAQIEIPSKKITAVTDRNLRVVRWDEDGKELILSPETSGNTADEQRYKKMGDAWSLDSEVERQGDANEQPEISLEEDMNNPPKIFASNAKTKQKILLLDLNPQLAGIDLAREEAITWRASDGHTVTGGLYLPAHFRQGVRYPLVIQTHGFDASRFSFDGPFSSVFAAQPLASAGFVVLQVGASTNLDEDRKALNTPEEAPRQMAAYEGAIDYLDSRGLIDKNRVGIVGFSRTVFHVSYALTHSKYKFAAAVLADGFDAGYLNSLFWWDAQDYSAVNGSKGFGSALSFWLQSAPGFNLDKVSASVRLEYYGPTAPLDAWEFFSGLSDLEKPVDFVWLPFGTHLLVKPWERYTSLQGTVDWFNFWLKDEENPAASNQAQNQRWERLRDRTDAHSITPSKN
jgi:dipeptidyl aminopeptidase/acylaminoacyl peptidase